MGPSPRPLCCRRLDQLHSRTLLATLIFTCAATVVVTVTASNSPNRSGLADWQGTPTALLPNTIAATNANGTASLGSTSTASMEATASTASLPRLQSHEDEASTQIINTSSTRQYRQSRAARIGDFLSGDFSHRCSLAANSSVCQSTSVPVLLQRSSLNMAYPEPAALAADHCNHVISSTETLKYCGSLNLWSVLNNTVKQGATAMGCASDYLYDFVRELRRLDEEIGQLYRSFSNLIGRFDCQEPYSISYTCQDCKEAYLDWLCSMHVPFYSRHGMRLKPCVSVCQRVELMCPYFLPSERFGRSTQFAGEPTFLCQDPVVSQSEPYLPASEDCCLHSCCLNSHHTWCSSSTCQMHSKCPRADYNPGHDTSDPDSAAVAAASSQSSPISKRHDNRLNSRSFYYRRLRHWRHHRRRFRHRSWRRHRTRHQHHVYHHATRWHHHRYRRQLQPQLYHLSESAGHKLKTDRCLLLFLLLFLLSQLCAESYVASLMICLWRNLCVVIEKSLSRWCWGKMDLLLQTVMVLLQTFTNLILAAIV